MNIDLLALTEEEFDLIPYEDVFAVLITNKLSKYIEYSLAGKKLIFVAQKGRWDDWAIYTLPFQELLLTTESINDNMPMYKIIQEVYTHGYKPFTEEIIRSVVPCTDAVFKKYRK